MAGNVIYRGPVTTGWQPRTISDKTVAGAYLPGTFVEAGATTLIQLTTALAKLPMILTNMEFKDQDIDTAYASGDTGVAYHLEPGQIYQARLAAATYAKGAPLTIGAAGRLTAATAATPVVAFFDDTPGAYSAGALADVIIANTYTVPAA
ncbi:hypothetical protein E4191_07650 [Paracoccus liaowanqingii]|uniref:Uncharacterized protein n=1 Tax=Paracoccus liaowanqingii TaxID=2560053 RepID=A0A4P7HKA6_9RHOB|nr:hypothetical protein [Paracoccus liaowanqingii]QBX34599.1 hypothetical protein E4191_07650 [Paracoccus liaowanqingii]